jgi:hypothetical protein
MGAHQPSWGPVQGARSTSFRFGLVRSFGQVLISCHTTCIRMHASPALDSLISTGRFVVRLLWCAAGTRCLVFDGVGGSGEGVLLAAVPSAECVCAGAEGVQ